MDDYLKNFGSVSAKTSNNQSSKRRAVSTHLEEDRKSIQKQRLLGERKTAVF